MLFRSCRANQVNAQIADTRLRAFINQTLIPRDVHEAQQAINQGQSTHTGSIHRTTSQSAIRLYKRYSERIQEQVLDNILKAVQAFVDAQPEREVEKRCISQLLNEPYEFTDPGSQVTTKTLIALSWLAIHDDNERTGDLKDAEDKFLEALYDINRAYNLTVNFEDMGGADRKACAAGTFNKFIEKLVGIHSDAEQEYITHKTAYLKSKPIILEEANGYLETLTPEALQALGVNELKAAKIGRAHV